MFISRDLSRFLLSFHVSNVDSIALPASLKSVSVMVLDLVISV